MLLMMVSQVKSVLGASLIDVNQALAEEAIALNELLNAVRKNFYPSPLLASSLRGSSRTLVRVRF